MALRSLSTLNRTTLLAVGLVSFTLATAFPHANAGTHAKNQNNNNGPVTNGPVAENYEGRMYSTDNPNVRLPNTLPNWLLLPQSDTIIETGVDTDAGYIPILIAGTPVVSSPYYGVQTEFEGSDLLVNAASINKDLALLHVRQNFYNALTKRGEPIPQHSILELSGMIETQITKGSDFDNDSYSDINLTAAELDIFAGVNEWISAFMQIEYDPSYDGRTRRVNNSRVKIGSAFVTLGNLDYSDFYFTIGQMYLPFGQYSTSLVTNSFARDIGRTKARAGLLGYTHERGVNSVNASVFAFRGETDTNGSFFKGPDHVNGVGGNLGYHYDGAVVDIALGASIINNLAESDGMQTVFALSQYYQHIEHEVPGIDLRATIKAKGHTLLAEYVTATRSFDKELDLAQNGHGAQPEAVHVEYGYNFKMFNRPNTFAIGFDRSWDSLALGIPEKRIGTTWSINPFKATLFSLEYRYDKDYDDNDVAGTVYEDGFQNEIYAIGTGNCAHTLTAQINVFF